LEPRKLVAREAARLLYTGASEEYKHAKEQAASSLGIKATPSNHEVAIELDLLAELTEGDERRNLLISMRDSAMKLMQALTEYGPLLVGSVWRGTARKGSDVDITVYANRPRDVESTLDRSGYKIEESEEVTVTKRGRPVRSRHIRLRLGEGIDGEVVVRPPEERGEVESCEIYGDPKQGLALPELEKLMKTDPLRKFVPRRRYK
jgi:predicted nucleotidyltransferase